MENNINKFLNREMSLDEERVFRNSAEYKKYQNVLELLDNSKAIPFDETNILHKINTKKTKATKKVIPLYKKWLPIAVAASILICFSLFYMYSSQAISYNTIAGESAQFSLPDKSSVWLNAKSNISHNKDWGKSRDISLQGEAYFEVAKGKTFTVRTQQGTVKVLGTKFNVKQRQSYFEVHCFEGSVSVSYKGIKTVLKANDFFNSNTLKKQTKNIEKPNWTTQKSIFNNTSLQEVITDISIQYGVGFKLDNSIKNTLLHYTGSYHYSENLETVLKVLSKSLHINYTINDKVVYLSVNNN